MIKFEDIITIDDKYGPAMKITDQTKADEYFEACVEHTMRFGNTRERAIEIERENLGYYAGYYDSETRERVRFLFNAEHPIFGKRTPSPDEALLKGVTMGLGIKDGG